MCIHLARYPFCCLDFCHHHRHPRTCWGGGRQTTEHSTPPCADQPSQRVRRMPRPTDPDSDQDLQVRTRCRARPIVYPAHTPFVFHNCHHPPPTAAGRHDSTPDDQHEERTKAAGQRTLHCTLHHIHRRSRHLCHHHTCSIHRGSPIHTHTTVSSFASGKSKTEWAVLLLSNAAVFHLDKSSCERRQAHSNSLPLSRTRTRAHTLRSAQLHTQRSRTTYIIQVYVALSRERDSKIRVLSLSSHRLLAR